MSRGVNRQKVNESVFVDFLLFVVVGGMMTLRGNVLLTLLLFSAGTVLCENSTRNIKKLYAW